MDQLGQFTNESEINMGEAEGWLQLGKEARIYEEDAGVILIESPYDNVPAIVAAAFSVLKFLTIETTGDPRYGSVELLVPPGETGEECRAEILSSIPKAVKQAGADELTVTFSPLMCGVRSMISLSTADLLQVLGQMPDGSACMLMYPELYRDSRLNQSEIGEKPTLREIAAGHFDFLLGELTSIAIRKKLLFLLAVDHARMEVSEIEGPDGIGFVSISVVAKSAKSADINTSHFREKFLEGGWASVRSDPAFDLESEEQTAFALASEFQMEGKLELVWQVMAPFALKISGYTTEAQLGLATAAMSVRENDAATEILMGAISEGLQISEELYAAAQLAYSLKRSDLLERVVGDMCRRFPDNPLTLRGEFLRRFEKRDFEGARQCSETLDDKVGVAQCVAFLADPIKPEPFLEEIGREGRLEEGLLSCVEEAFYRGDYLQALVLATEVSTDHQIFSQVFRLRIQALRIGFAAKRNQEKEVEEEEDAPKKQTAEEFEEVVLHLKESMRVVAGLPTRTDLRRAVEHLLEHQLEEPLVLRLLSALLMESASEQARFDDEVIEKHRTHALAKDWNKGIQSESDIGRFLEDFQEMIANAPGEQISIGQGVLGDKLKPAVGPRLIDSLSYLALGALEHEREVEGAAILIHIVCLCCKEEGDSVMDLTLVHSAIERLAVLGAAQEARNLAETALQHLPPLHPEHSEWRISQGWSALAESCIRTGNLLAALRYLCFSFLQGDEKFLSVELSRRRYRMGARIFRDLGFLPLSLAFVVIERHLLTKAEALDSEEVTLEVFEMQLKLRLGAVASEEDLLGILGRAKELLDKNVESEMYPLLTIQASIIHRLTAEKCPADIIEDFRKRLNGLQPNMKDLLSLTAHTVPTTADIAKLLKSLPDAQDHEYLSHQIFQALPALERALRHAVCTCDSELFLMAAGAFAQPALSVKTLIGSGEVRQEGSGTLLQTTTIEGLKEKRIDYIPRYSFAPLAEITLQSLQTVAAGTEEILVMACSPSDPPAILSVTQNGAAGLSTLAWWSVEAFAIWRSRFIRELFWEKPKSFVPGIDSLGPPLAKIRKEFAGLELRRPSLPEYLTVVPPGHLFGFAWQLSVHNGGFLGEFTKAAVVPSAGWLISARSNPWLGSSLRKAWLGSRHTPDTTLVGLKHRVGAELDYRGFTTEEGNMPSDFNGCEVAFIAAHGGTGEADFFRSANDRISHYSPAEMAFLLRDCGCVILAVCSGGRSDRQTGTTETLGLVSSLLRAGVRCVVAPPWPLDIDVVEYWLPVFLRSLDEGKCVGDAAADGREAVRMQLDHPCAWGQLHVYGDQLFQLPSKVSESAKEPCSVVEGA